MLTIITIRSQDRQRPSCRRDICGSREVLIPAAETILFSLPTGMRRGNGEYVEKQAGSELETKNNIKQTNDHMVNVGRVIKTSTSALTF